LRADGRCGLLVDRRLDGAVAVLRAARCGQARRSQGGAGDHPRARRADARHEPVVARDRRQARDRHGRLRRARAAAPAVPRHPGRGDRGAEEEGRALAAPVREIFVGLRRRPEARRGGVMPRRALRLGAKTAAGWRKQPSSDEGSDRSVGDTLPEAEPNTTTRRKFDSVWDAIEPSAADAASMKARSQMMMAIRETVEAWDVTQAVAAKRLGLTQPRMNDLIRGRLSKFSLDALINIAARAGLAA